MRPTRRALEFDSRSFSACCAKGSSPRGWSHYGVIELRAALGRRRDGPWMSSSALRRQAAKPSTATLDPWPVALKLACIARVAWYASPRMAKGLAGYSFSRGPALFILLAACGGRSNSSDTTRDPPNEHGGAGGATSGGTCIADFRSEDCDEASDCCSGICNFDFSPKDNRTGTCWPRCYPTGSQCVDGGCCSGVCDYKGRCTCASTGLSCITDDYCCSGFCFTARSVCLAPSCDPRLHPDADPEACWSRDH
jgi:hypothetical protein